MSNWSFLGVSEEFKTVFMFTTCALVNFQNAVFWGLSSVQTLLRYLVSNMTLETNEDKENAHGKNLLEFLNFWRAESCVSYEHS